MKKIVLKTTGYKRFLMLSAIMLVLVFGALFFRSQRVDGKIKEIGDYVYADVVKIKTGSGDDDFDTISGYSGFNWEKDIESVMKLKTRNLINEYGKTLSGSPNWSDINPNKKPEGQVWVIPSGGLTINSPIIINGKATIIIESGNLNINADMSYKTDKSSIGFIVMNGNVIIANDISTVGAYYASNEIVFN